MTDITADTNASLVSDSLLNILDLTVTAVISFGIILRPLSAGQPFSEPETAFITMLIWFAVLVWGLRKTLAGDLVLPRTGIWLFLLLYLVSIGFAVSRAASSGTAQPAFDQGLVWLTDIALLVVIVDHFSHPTRFRLMVSALLAGLVAVAVYAIYQRFVGLEYLRHTIDAVPGASARVSGSNKVMQGLFRSRVMSDRASGPFAYPNALAGFVLLLLPLLLGMLRSSSRSILLWAGVAFSMLAIVYSGSKAGFLTAKVIEWIGMLLLLKPGTRSFGKGLRLFLAIVAATAFSLLIVAGVYWQWPAGGSPSLAGATLFALLWCGEIFAIGRMVVSEKTVPFGICVCGAVLSLAAIIGSAIILQGIEPDMITRSGRGGLDTVRVEVSKTLNARYNYWVSGVRMFRKHPFRGVGLDNYGVNYTSFKTMRGWAVRRAHNLYVQLAADGGLPLLLSFVGLFVCFFRTPATREKLCAGEKDAVSPEQIRLLGVAGGIAAFAITYFAYPVFVGLSYEYFFIEVLKGPDQGSVYAATGDITKLLIHGAVTFLIMPGIWILVFLASWSRVGDAESLRPWLRLGVAAVLIHSLAEFHFSTAAVSCVFWIVAGLSLVTARQKRGAGRTKSAASALLWCGGCGAIVLGLVYPYLLGCFAARNAEPARDALQVKTISTEEKSSLWREAITRGREAIKLRPYDANLYRYQSDVLMGLFLEQINHQLVGMSSSNRNYKRRQLIKSADPMVKEEILSLLRTAIRLDHNFSANHAGLGRHLLKLYPDDMHKTEEALQAFTEAARLHPWKPLYRLWQARVSLMLKQTAAAARYASEALEIDKQITDDRAFLTKEEEAEATRMVDLFSS